MNKRPIPVPKAEEEIDALDSFISSSPKPKEKKTELKEEKKKETPKPRKNRKIAEENELVKKSLKIDINIDTALKLEAVHTRHTQEKIVEVALREYLKKKGHKNI